MITRILLCFFFLISISASSQILNRVEVTGKVIVNSEDLEGITVYNTGSKEGVTTNAEGFFTIAVTLKDVLEFRALQFQEFRVTIDERILESRQLSVFLIEKVNALDEVVLLPYGLSGNLNVDVNSIKTFNPDMNAIYFGIKHSDEYEFPADYKTEVENMAMYPHGETLQHGLNVANLMGIMIKPLFRKSSIEEKTTNIPVSKIKTYYSNKFLVDNYNIPEDKVEDFVYWVETHGLTFELLESGRELEFMEFLGVKSDEYLKEIGVKN
jgi:hypothetical protein